MKSWQFWVIIIVVILIIVPVIVYSVSVKAASNIIAANPGIASNVHLDSSGYASSAPPQK